MKIGILSCRSMEPEMRKAAADIPAVRSVDIMPWELHIEPDRLLDAVTEKIREMENAVDAVVLGYGRCQAMDRLPGDFRVPVFRPQAEDCIGVLLGQDRYEHEIRKEPGTWFFTPGWTELGMEFIFDQLQISAISGKLAVKQKSPVDLARHMLRDYTRALYIDTGLDDQDRIMSKARRIATRFRMRFEWTRGTTGLLRDTIDRAAAYLESS